MEEKPSFRPFLFASLFFSIFGIGGLVVLFVFAYPYTLPRLLFFVCLSLSLIGLGLPVSYWLHRRFAPSQPPQVVLRSALWLAGYGALLAWLQADRLLTFPAALWLGLGFSAWEVILRWRGKSAAASESHE